jgi:AcrR family transcriptional regulator
VSVDVPTGEATRARILRVALTLVAERGFAATSTRELSERLGFTKAALYYHFRTKDDLLTALVSPVQDALTALATNTPLGTTVAARRAVLASYIDIVTAHLELIRVLTQDPAVTCRQVPAAQTAAFARLTQLLAGSDQPSVTERLRVHAALGAIRDALLLGDTTDDPAVIRSATMAAACGALGIPAPRGPAAHRR